MANRIRHPKRPWRSWWRAARLAYHLTIRPRDAVPYLRSNVLAHGTPLDDAVPWWSFGAVRALEPWLRPDHEAFEFGSGGSTLFVGARVRSLTCVEDSEKWAALVTAAARERGLGTITVLHRPFDFWRTRGFGSSAYLLALGGREYDLIIVDGTEWTDPVRDQCFWRAEDHISPGGVIVVDDSHRYPQILQRHRAKSVREFRGAGYCRAGVTTTALFHY